jgi:CHAT domain-containing protein/Tfp pilus assembly protein PilF
MPASFTSTDSESEITQRGNPQRFKTVENRSNNLGATLTLLGRPNEAEPFIRQALAAQTDISGERDHSTLDSLNNLATNLMAQGRHDEAEPVLRKTLLLRTEVLGERDTQVMDSLNVLGVNLTAQGRPAEAEVVLRKAVRLQTEVLGENHPDTAGSLANLATALMDEDRSAEAEPLIRKSLEAMTRLRGEGDQAAVGYLQNLAVVLRDQARFGEAETLFVKAMKLQTEAYGEQHPDTLRTMGNLALDQLLQGRVAEAFPLLMKTLKLQTAVLGERHPDTLGTIYLAALTGNALGAYDKVEPALSEALRTDAEVLGPHHPNTLASALLLADIRLKMPGTQALAPARIAVAGWRARQDLRAGSASDEAGLAREALQHQSAFLVLAEAAWRGSLAAPDQAETLRSETYLALQDSMMGAASQAMAETAARNAAEGSGPGLGALARERQQQSDRWRANNAAQTKALTDPAGAQPGHLLGRLNDDQVAIEADIARIDTRLKADFPDYFALVRPKPLDLTATQKLLKPGEAILLVVPTDYGTQIMAVTSEGSKWVRAPWDAKQVSAAVRRLLWDAGAAVSVDEKTRKTWELISVPGSYDRKTAYALYQQIVAPVADILAGKRQLFVAAGGSLTSLPFGMLVTEPPGTGDGQPAALRATKWFADAHALTVIPSIQSLQLLRSGEVTKRRHGVMKPFAAYGDPLLEGEPQALGSRGRGGASARSMFLPASLRSGAAIADITQLRLLERLPGTAVEMENMRAALGAPPESVHVQRDATEAAIKSADLAGVRVLAFATHGLMAGELPGSAEPGLVFTLPAVANENDDGLLTSSEISGLKLDADWVILSACNTAAGDGTEGAPGLSGLARAFFYAGARNLLVSHWPVRDDVASLLTVETIKLQQANPSLSRAEALQQAMRAIRDDPSHDATGDTWAHPSAWAPFSLIGDGAKHDSVVGRLR